MRRVDKEPFIITASITLAMPHCIMRYRELAGGKLPRLLCTVFSGGMKWAKSRTNCGRSLRETSTTVDRESSPAEAAEKNAPKPSVSPHNNGRRGSAGCGRRTRCVWRRLPNFSKSRWNIYAATTRRSNNVRKPNTLGNHRQAHPATISIPLCTPMRQLLPTLQMQRQPHPTQPKAPSIYRFSFSCHIYPKA